MGRSKIIGIIIAATGAGLFFLIGFLTYGTIHSSGSQFYTPSPSLIRSPEPILIRTDIGKIKLDIILVELKMLLKLIIML